MIIVSNKVNYIRPSGREPQYKLVEHRPITIVHGISEIKETGVNLSSLDGCFLPFGTTGDYLPQFSQKDYAMSMMPFSGISYYQKYYYNSFDAKLFTGMAFRFPFAINGLSPSVDPTAQIALGTLARSNILVPLIYWDEGLGVWDFGQPEVDNNLGDNVFQLYGIAAPLLLRAQNILPNSMRYSVGVNITNDTCSCNSPEYTGVPISGCNLAIEYPSGFHFSGTTVIPIVGIKFSGSSNSIFTWATGLAAVSQSVRLDYLEDCTWISDEIVFSGYQAKQIIRPNGTLQSSSVFIPSPNGDSVTMQATLTLNNRVEGNDQYYVAHLLWERVSYNINTIIGTGNDSEIVFMDNYPIIPIQSESYINHKPFNPFRTNTLFWYSGAKSNQGFFGNIGGSYSQCGGTTGPQCISNPYLSFNTMSLETICLNPI